MPGLIDGLEKTTLILGAGASAPYGFPLGVELRNQLLEAHSTRDALLSELGFPDLEPFRRSLRRYQANSIDDFLQRYPELAWPAKLQIAYHLMHHEDDDGHIDHQRHDDWYQYLYFQVLGNDEWLGKGKLSIITFNYDLSLEAYLFRTLCARHRIPEHEARSRVEAFPIVHVHGHLGTVEFLHGKGRPYGRTRDVAHLNSAAKRIVTVHDEPTAKLWERAHKILEDTRHLLFLGFGFGSENLTRLALNSKCFQLDRAFLGQLNCEYAMAQFSNHAPGKVCVLYPEGTSTATPTLDRVKWFFRKAREQDTAKSRMDSRQEVAIT